MRLVHDTDRNQWAILHEDRPVAIGGQMYFDERESIVELIAARGLTISGSGELIKVVAQEDTIHRTVSHGDTTVHRTSFRQEPAQGVPEPGPASEEPHAAVVAPERPAEAERGDSKATPRRGRGRPRQYTEEEAKERRREQNRRYYRQREDRRRAEIAERSKQWLEDHPEKVKEYRQKANAKRRERYKNDPEYRAKVDAANRAYQERKRAEKES